MADTATPAAPDPKYASQIWEIMSLGPDAAEFQPTTMYTDADGNSSGQQIPNSAYDPNLAAARDYLVQNGYLTTESTGGGSEDNNSVARYGIGPNAPHNLAAYDLTNAGVPSAERLVSVDQAARNKQTLINPNFTENTPWGTLTMQGNIQQPKTPITDALFQYAPMLVGAFASIVSGGTLTPAMAAMVKGFEALPTITGLIDGAPKATTPTDPGADLAWSGPNWDGSTPTTNTSGATPSGQTPTTSTTAPPPTSTTTPSGTTPAATTGGAAPMSKATEIMNLLEGKNVTMTGANGAPGDKLQSLSKMFNLLN